MAYEYKGQHDEAIVEFQRGVELSHGDPVAKAFLARSYAAAGKKRSGHSDIERTVAAAAKEYVPPTEIADTFAALGRKDEGFQWLNKAYDERAAALVYLKVAQVYDPLRSDPRFTELLKRLHLT